MTSPSATRVIAKRFLIGFCCFIMNDLCIAQITFNKTYDSGGYEGIFNILPVDSGYCMVMNLNQSPDGFQINFLDSLGNVSQSQSFFFPSGSLIVWSLLKTNDQNFMTGCHFINYGTGIRNVFLAKLNNQGDTIWTKNYLASSGFQYYGRYILETSDFGFLITGAFTDSLLTNPEFCILKTDSLGNLEWVQSFGGVNTEDAFSSVETPDKGFLTLGFTRSFGFGNSWNRDELLVKWDSLGNYQWHKTYGSIDDEYSICISKLADGNYLLGSITYNASTSIQNGKLIKVDVNGDVIWQKYYSSKSSFWWLQEQSNNDIVVVGSSRQSNNIDDGLIIRTDSAGIQKWRRQYRFGNDHCYFRDVKETPDGGIICAGFVFDGASGNQDGWLVKLDSTGCLSAVNCGQPTGLLDVVASSSYDISIAPNPVVDQAIIKVDGLPQHLLQEHYQVTIFDITGKKILSPVYGYLISETGIQFIFKRETLQPGIYLLEMVTAKGERIGTLKVVTH